METDELCAINTEYTVIYLPAMNRNCSRKKGFSLPELLVGVAIFGLFTIALYYVFRGGNWWSYRTQKLNEVQQSAAMLMDHLNWDIRGAYSFQSCSGGDLKMQVYKKNSASQFAHNPTLHEAMPSVIDVEYSFDSANRVVTRQFGSNTFRYHRVKEFVVQGFEVEEPDFPLIASTNLDKIVAVGVRAWIIEEARMHDEDQDIELLSLIYSKSRILLKMFGVQSAKYGYFSSLEEASF